jgi:glycosyltransferase involved in cell wall biosynthesis
MRSSSVTSPLPAYDVVMTGTFAAWRLGTLQARALPLATALQRHGVRCALVTVPWDLSSERGVLDIRSRVPLWNTSSASLRLTPVAVRQQLRAIAALQPRVVHVMKPRGFGGLSGTLLRQTPVLVDADDWEGDGGWNRIGRYPLLQRRMFDWQERTLLRDANGVTAASTLLAQRARALRDGPGRGCVWHVPNVLPDEWIAELTEACGQYTPVLDDTPTILLYSRFEEFGPDWLPRLLRALDDATDCPLRVRVIGDTQPPCVDSVGRVVVELMGYVARDRLPRLLASASVAVFPYEDSLVSRSKNSVKLLELLAAGCPVIASDTGDVAPTIGEAGILLDGHAPEAFGRTVVTLLRHHALLHLMREAGPRRIRASFAPAARLPTLLAAYEMVTPS